MGEREAVACVWACEHWHTYLLGRHFTLRTDHQSLVSLLSSQGTGRRPLHFTRWSERLLRYNYTVEYRKGSENQVADALSRLSVPCPSEKASFEEVVSFVELPCLTKEQFQQAQRQDWKLEQVATCVATSWPAHKTLSSELQPFFLVREELLVVDNLQHARRTNRCSVVSHAASNRCCPRSSPGYSSDKSLTKRKVLVARHG